MIKIAELANRYVQECPFLEEGLARGIINYSALAREIRPVLEAELGKPVSPGAIMMALKRMSPKLAKRRDRKAPGLKHMGELIVRSDLVEFTFRPSDTIWEKQKRLLQRIARDRQTFLTYTQGVFEVMLIASAGIEKAVLEIFGSESIISQLKALSAIIIRLSPRTVHIPGVYYSILKQLAWGNVNVIDVVSTFTEFTVLVEKDQVDQAFVILKRHLWP